MDVTNLTEEQKAEILAAAEALKGMGGDMSHMDAKADEEVAAEQNAVTVEMLLPILEWFKEEIENLNKAVFDELIGGVSNLYKKNKKEVGIKGLREKYGAQFGPYEDSFRNAADGSELFDRLYDYLEDLKTKAGEGWNDEAEGGAIGSLFDKLKSTFKEKVEPITEAVEESGEAPKVVEVETVSAADGSDDLLDRIKRKTERLKGRK